MNKIKRYEIFIGNHERKEDYILLFLNQNAPDHSFRSLNAVKEFIQDRVNEGSLSSNMNIVIYEQWAWDDPNLSNVEKKTEDTQVLCWHKASPHSKSQLRWMEPERL